MVNSKSICWGEYVPCMREESSYKIFVGKPGEGGLGRLRLGWEDNIKKYFKEI